MEEKLQAPAMDELPKPGLTTPDGEWSLNDLATMTPERIVNALWQDAERKLLHEATAALVYHDAQSLVGALAEAAREADAEAAEHGKAHKKTLAESGRLRKAWQTARDELGRCKPADRGKWEQKTKAARDAHLDAEQGWQTARSLAHDASTRAASLRELAHVLGAVERPAMDAWRVVLALANGRK